MKDKKNNKFERKHPLQAVLIAEDFDGGFRIASKSRPFSLMPLAGVPILEYALHYLSKNKVEEIFLCCRSHVNLIEEYVQSSKWGIRVKGRPIVNIIASIDFQSVGDVLRDLESRNVVKSNFVLLTSPVIADIPLAKFIEDHKARLEKNKNFTMTVLYQDTNPNDKHINKAEKITFSSDSETGKMVYFSNSTHKKSPVIDAPKNAQLYVSDLATLSNIYICTETVLPLFYDNFDFQTMADFIKGIIMNEDVMGNTIHISKTDNFSVALNNLINYDAISQKLMHGKVPFYKEFQIKANLSEGKILYDNIVGKNISLNYPNTIVRSVIGENCQIGKNVSILNSYLWNNVKVADGCHLENCIVADNVEINHNVTISPGCTLSEGVVVGPNVKIPKKTIIQQKLERAESFESEKMADINLANLGSNSKASSYRNSLPSATKSFGNIWGDDYNTNLTYESEESEEEEVEMDDNDSFYTETLESLSRCIDENINPENLIIEINSLKYAYNISIKNLIHLTVKAILNLPIHRNKDITLKEYANQIKEYCSRYLLVLEKYVIDEESQMECIVSLETNALEKELALAKASLQKILQCFYESELLPEETILNWYNNPSKIENLEPEKQLILRKNVEPFISWLQDAEEESTDSD